MSGIIEVFELSRRLTFEVRRCESAPCPDLDPYSFRKSCQRIDGKWNERLCAKPTRSSNFNDSQRFYLTGFSWGFIHPTKGWSRFFERSMPLGRALVESCYLHGTRCGLARWWRLGKSNVCSFMLHSVMRWVEMCKGRRTLSTLLTWTGSRVRSITAIRPQITRVGGRCAALVKDKENFLVVWREWLLCYLASMVSRNKRLLVNYLRSISFYLNVRE